MAMLQMLSVYEKFLFVATPKFTSKMIYCDTSSLVFLTTCKKSSN